MSEYNDPTAQLDQLAENQAPAKSMAGKNELNDQDQSEQEIKTVRMVEKLFNEAKRARSTYDRRWLEFYKFFKGKQWKEKRPTYRHSEVLNFIFSEIQTIIPIMTDNRPNIETVPEEPHDYEFSEIITHILRSKWDVHNWNYTVAELLLDGMIYGTGIVEVPWNKKKLNGLGDFDFKTRDPLYCYPDPNAEDVNGDKSGYFITAEPTDIKVLKALYPDKADKIKPDLADLYLSKTSREDLDEYRLKSPVDNRVITEDGKAFNSARPNQALFITCYMKSDEMVQIAKMKKDSTGVDKDGIPSDPDDEAQESEEEMVKKYPNGRKICIANGFLLDDGPMEYMDGHFPFARYIDHPIPREFWGIGEVEMLESPQQIINKLWSYALDVLIIMGNPIWVVDTNSGVDTDNLFNIPGAVIEKNPKTEVRREMGVELQPYVLELMKNIQEGVFEKLGSAHHVSQGAAPFGGASGYAINQLQEAAQTKIRAKSRNLEVTLKKCGDMMVNRILQFYSIPRIIRITGDGNAAKYFKFSMSEEQDESGATKKTASVIPYTLDEGSGSYKEGPLKEYDIKSTLDVKISTGTTLPFAKVQRQQTDMQLFEKGIIDVETLLKNMEYPNYENVIQKLKDRSADAAAQGQKVQQPPPMPPPAVQ